MRDLRNTDRAGVRGCNAVYGMGARVKCNTRKGEVMTPEEMQKNVCGPVMNEIRADLKDLVKTIKISNGKPCVLSRLETLEHSKPQGTLRKLSIGRNGLHMEGYDPFRVFVGLSIGFLILHQTGLVKVVLKWMGIG